MSDAHAPESQKKESPLPKAYEPQAVEADIYAAWEKSGYFNPDNLPVALAPADARPYVVMMPPPNRTGTLHVGHAVGIAVQDLLTRFNRMAGKRALWMPGTDHAAIATQVKVEGLLIAEGMKEPRKELGREKFLERVVAFAEESGNTIISQTKSMGASCDWSRLAYTFDEPRNRAVNEMFVRMHEDGIIERGFRMVNWDPKMQSNISDDEIEWVEKQAPFYYFQYGPFVIGTSRPETKFGDKYVVMHPEDERYAQYKDGQKIDLEWINGPITATVIKDAVIDREFGTGVMTITPWHDAVDFDLAERHGLDKEQVIDTNGKLLPIAGDFAGMGIEEAREKMVERLKEKGLLVKIDENYMHRVATNSRGGGTIEPQIMRQWFVRVNKPFALRQHTLGKWKKGDAVTLKELMAHAVSSGQVAILPEASTKVYFSWIDNLRDWCISRQIWFGHRIPAWYRGDEIRVSATSPGADWVQDPDTLDTWFSSGTWTFSTLGWPDTASVDADGNLVKSGDLAAFHPTDMLETGRDIIFFWVARMILMSTYALGEVPFRTTYLHGLVRDELGRKMSKSLGNIIDPREVAGKFGTDAVRLSLIFGNTPGQDTRLGEEKIAYFRNFTNKLWNIARFALMNVKELAVVTEAPAPKTAADRWILRRLSAVIASVTADLESYNLLRPAETLRDFTWGELADWYLEIAKIEGDKDEILSYVLLAVLKLWHPMMPFVTEAIYAKTFAAGERDFLMVAPWPKAPEATGAAVIADEFDLVRELVTAFRNLRATNGVEPAKRIDAVIAAGNRAAFLNENAAVLKGMVKMENLTISAEAAAPEGSASAVVGGAQLFMPLAGLIDTEKEKARLAKELADAEKYVEVQSRKLDNADFVARAPAQVIAGEREKLAAAKDKAVKLKEQLEAMK